MHSHASQPRPDEVAPLTLVDVPVHVPRSLLYADGVTIEDLRVWDRVQSADPWGAEAVAVSHRRIAADLGRTVGAVGRNLRRLVALGALEVIYPGRFGAGARAGDRNVYRVAWRASARAMAGAVDNLAGADSWRALARAVDARRGTPSRRAPARAYSPPTGGKVNRDAARQGAGGAPHPHPCACDDCLAYVEALVEVGA